MPSKIAIKAFQQWLDRNAPATAISAGLVPGAMENTKFGFSADDSVPSDIWPIAGGYTFPDDAGESIEVVSDNVADTALLLVTVIDQADGMERSVAVTLTGTTPVVIADPALVLAVNRAFVVSGPEPIGTVTIRTTGGAGNTFAVIQPGENQTLQCPYMVPANKWARTYRIAASVNKSGNPDANAILRYRIRTPGGVFRTLAKWGLQKEGTSLSDIDLVHGSPLIPPGSQIRFAFDPGTDTVSMSGRYTLWLLDADYLPAQ
jgi:hypothetical protein